MLVIIWLTMMSWLDAGADPAWSGGASFTVPLEGLSVVPLGTPPVIHSKSAFAVAQPKHRATAIMNFEFLIINFFIILFLAT